MKPEDIPQEVWDIAFEAMPPINREVYDRSPYAMVLHLGFAKAIMAAEKRGEEAAQAKMAALLKDPAAVRVNYLRGDIACQDLIREGEEREREAIAVDADECARIAAEPDLSAFAAAIRNRGKP